MEFNTVNIEKIKAYLFSMGYDTISEFLGYDYPEDEDDDTTDSRMDMAIENMDDDELNEWYNRINQ